MSHLAVNPQSTAKRQTLSILFAVLAIAGLAVVGLGVIGAAWSGVHVEVLILWLFGPVLTAIAVAGCTRCRSGHRAVRMLIAWSVVFVALAGLLAIVE